VLLAAALAACTGTHAPRWPAPAGTPAFQAGWTDGCHTGVQAAADRPHPLARKDSERFEHDADYREGWRAGRETCYRREGERPRPRLLSEPGEPGPPGPIGGGGPKAGGAPGGGGPKAGGGASAGGGGYGGPR